MWRTGYAGIRFGEAENPGHGRRGPKGYNQRASSDETKKDHIWIRSHNVGSIRTHDRREKAFDADIDVFAFQETNADITTMHDGKNEFSKKQLRPYGVKRGGKPDGWWHDGRCYNATLLHPPHRSHLGG